MTFLVANSKSTALEASRIVAKDDALASKSAHIAVLVDRDDDRTSGWDGQVLRTEGRDLDAELAALPGVLEKVIRSVHRVSEKSRLLELANSALKHAHLRRAVRETSFDLGLGLNVDRLDVKASRLAVSDLTAAADALGVTMGREKFLSHLEAAFSRPPSISQCCGHDLHLIVSWGARSFGRDQVQSNFMVAIDSAQFFSTPTGRALSDWATKNGAPIDTFIEHAA
ncbi:hypothetical protein [Janibacter massiliensis]|uniref:hypothetical protein n=1 Tax=Janibacter massiliensis TaxID=2058291 RepID=UPI00131A5F4D|nr:hypothetical protein [Janibacter massiliensis]